MKNSFLSLLTGFLFIQAFALFSEKGMAQDWPHWRGPHRNDLSTTSSGFWDDKWHLTEIWNANHGVGSSSPITFRQGIYSFTWVHGKEVLTKSKVAAGQEIEWSNSYIAPSYGRLATGDQGLFSGPSSTPEFDPLSNQIYSLGSDGHLTCWDATKRGNIVWQKSLYKDYKIPRRPKVGRSGLRDYGFTTTPLLFNNQVIVEVGAIQGTVMAFDPSSGKELWKSEIAWPAGHTGGPVPIIVESIPCVAVMTHNGLVVVRTDKGNEGKTLAKVNWLTEWANNIATPTVFQNKVVITSGYNQNRIALFEISSSGAKEIWRVAHPSKICSPIIFKNKVYYCWRKIRCLDLETGKLIWQGGNTGDAGSMVLTSDQRIIVWSKNGDLSLIETAENSPNRLKILASKKVFSKTDAWPHVIVTGQKIICKDRLGNMKCFAVATKP